MSLPTYTTVVYADKGPRLRMGLAPHPAHERNDGIVYVCMLQSKGKGKRPKPPGGLRFECELPTVLSRLEKNTSAGLMLTLALGWVGLGWSVCTWVTACVEREKQFKKVCFHDCGCPPPCFRVDMDLCDKGVAAFSISERWGVATNSAVISENFVRLRCGFSCKEREPLERGWRCNLPRDIEAAGATHVYIAPSFAEMK